MEEITDIMYLGALQDELFRYYQLYQKDVAEGFANKRFETTITCHLEDISLLCKQKRGPASLELQLTVDHLLKLAKEFHLDGLRDMLIRTKELLEQEYVLRVGPWNDIRTEDADASR